jgi:hypothetical protein
VRGSGMDRFSISCSACLMIARSVHLLLIPCEPQIGNHSATTADLTWRSVGRAHCGKAKLRGPVCGATLPA